MSESFPPKEAAEFVNRHQAASILNCSHKTISRLIGAGRLKAIDVGVGRNRHYRIAVAELERFKREAAVPAIITRQTRRSRHRKPFIPFA